MGTLKIGVQSTLLDLVTALTDASVKIDRAMDGAVADVAREGNRLAQANARRTAGKHGKLYPRSFRAERRGNADFVYGPVSTLPQGGMSFEFGSRKQPPHLDLAHSADVIGPKLADKIGDAIDEALR